MSTVADMAAILAVVVSAVALIVSIFYNRKLISVNIAKDKPFVRVYTESYGGFGLLDSPVTLKLYVKNDGGSIAYNVALVVNGIKYGPFSLKVNESKTILKDITDKPIIDSLMYEDFYRNKYTEKNVHIGL